MEQDNQSEKDQWRTLFDRSYSFIIIVVTSDDICWVELAEPVKTLNQDALWDKNNTS